MKLLCSVDDLRSRLGYDQSPQIDNALKASIASATVSMATMLRTPFERHTYVDVFLPRSMVRQGTNPVCTLRLKAGFLVAGAPVSVVYNSTPATLGSGTDIAIGQAALVDSDRGVVNIFNTDLTNLYISVQYTAGFDVSNDGSSGEDQIYVGVPDWLTDAVMNRAIAGLDQNYGAYRSDRASSAGDLRGRIQAISAGIQPYIRYVPSAELPVSSTTIA